MLVVFSPIFVADTKIIHGYNFRAPLNKRLTFYLNAFRSFKSPGKNFETSVSKSLISLIKHASFQFFRVFPDMYLTMYTKWLSTVITAKNC